MYDVARHKDISFKIGIVSGSRDKDEECEKNLDVKKGILSRTISEGYV